MKSRDEVSLPISKPKIAVLKPLTFKIIFFLIFFFQDCPGGTLKKRYKR